MTPQPADARPSCMVTALDTIQAAQKLKMDPKHKGRVVEELPELYWAMLTEAAIYAELAKAPTDVGVIAGTNLTARDQQIRETAHRADTIGDDL